MEPENQNINPPSFQEPQKQNNIFLIILIIVSLVLIIITGIIGYYLGKKQVNIQSINRLTSTPIVSPTSISPTSKQIPTQSLTIDETEGWKTYEDTKNKFSLKYPSNFFTACYPNEGLKLWGPNFNCDLPHDIFYSISAIFYKNEDYKPYKNPSKSETIILAGKSSTKNTYIFDESDGPLYGLGEEKEILIPTPDGFIQLVLLGQDTKNKVFFDQILSTFKFIP